MSISQNSNSSKNQMSSVPFNELLRMTNENCDAFKAEIRAIEDPASQDQHYKMAVEYFLKKGENKPINFQLHMLEMVRNFISQSNVVNENMFFCIHDRVISLLYDPETKVKTSAPEELKYRTMYTLKLAIKNARKSALLKIYNAKYVQRLSPSIFVAIHMAKTEKALDVRKVALLYLRKLSQYHGTDKEVLSLLEMAYPKFVPGLIEPLSYLICHSTETTHHKIIKGSIICWAQVIVLTLNNPDEPEPVLTDEQQLQKWTAAPVAEEEDPEILKFPERSRKKWQKAAVVRLNTTFQMVSSACIHPHWDVQVSFAEQFARIIESCHKVLGDQTALFLDGIIGALGSDQPTVVAKGKQLMSSLQAKLGNKMWSELMDLWLYQKINRLNFGYKKQDEKMVAVELKLLSGLENIDNFFICPIMIGKLLELLVSLYRFEFSSVDILEEHDLNYINYQQNLFNVETSSSCLHDYMSRRNASWHGGNIEQICKLLGRVPAVKDIVSTLLDIYRANKSSPTPLVLLNHVLRSVPNQNMIPVDLIVDFFLDINDQINLEDFKGSPKNMQFTVFKVATVMLGFGAMATLFRGEFLLDILYPIIERVGCKYLAVHKAAVYAAKEIATAHNVDGIAGLVKENIDYLTNWIVKKLRRESSKVVLGAVRVISYLGDGSVDEMRHIIKQLLASSTRSMHISNYLQVFYAFLRCIPHQDSEQTVDIEPKYAVDKLRQFFERRNARRKQLSEAEDITEEELMEDAAAEEEPEDEVPGDEAVKLPPAITMAVDVVRRCLHYLPACNDSQKVLCLEVLELGVEVIAPYENELLPLVHEIWSPLVRRFNPQSKPLVIRNSFQLLVTLTRHARDFIRVRILKEVMQHLRSVLLDSAAKSYKQTHKSGYTCTQLYKLQRQLLSGLGPITTDLKLRERETTQVVAAGLPYLSCHQPSELQECAINLYLHLLTYDPTYVLYYLGAHQSEEFAANIEVIMSQKPPSKYSENQVGSRGTKSDIPKYKGLPPAGFAPCRDAVDYLTKVDKFATRRVRANKPLTTKTDNSDEFIELLKFFKEHRLAV